MSEMVERVAKALIERIGSPWEWDEMDPMVQRLWLGHARAAIEAMREPTGEMSHVGEIARISAPALGPRSHRANTTFKAMIDEALKE